MDNLNTPATIDVAQQLADEITGRSTSVAVQGDPVEEVLRENGFTNLNDGNTVVQRDNSIVVIPNNIPTPSMEETVEVVEEITPPSLELPEPETTDFNAEQAFAGAEEYEESEIEEDDEDDEDSLEVEESVNTEEIVETALSNNADVMELAIASALENAEGNDNSNMAVMTKEELLTLLPVNTGGYEIRESTARFSGASWFEDIQNQTVIVAGQGGIGSWVSMILSRMQPRQMFIYDDDVVETVNLAGQLYNKQSVGKKKVNAMATIMKDFSDYNGTMAVDRKWTEESEPGDIMICGFDNMAARKTFFESWLRHIVNHPHPEKCLYLDGRLSFTDMQVFCITGDDSFNIKRYNNEYLFSDAEAENTVCSMKQTTYCASIIGGIIVNLFTNFIANQRCPMTHDLPFKTFYDSKFMFFKTVS